MRELKGEKLEKELQRLDGMLSYEREYAALAPLCGIDEAGRGPLAGPVAAAAVILPENCRILYLNDSKKLSPARRDALFDEIREKAVSFPSLWCRRSGSTRSISSRLLTRRCGKR